MALPPLSTDQRIEALYLAYYGRAGEPDGVAYWRSQFDSGRTFAEVAAAFSTQRESVSQHPFLGPSANVTPAEFIESLYAQLLGRPSDAAGFAYWSAQLSAANGDPFRTGLMIAQFISGANDANGDAATILNKIQAGLYFTSELIERGVGGTLDGTKLDHFYSGIAHAVVDNDITSDPETVAINKVELDTFLSTMGPNTRSSIQLISLGNNGEQSNDGSASSRSAISADGRYVVFHSSATNLGPDGDNNADVFIRDTVLGRTLAVPAVNGGVSASISDDGVTVAFATFIDGQRQIVSWSHDGGFSPVSTTNGNFGNSSSEGPYVSGDARVFAYSGYATNLDSRDKTGFSDIYIFSPETGQSSLISYGANSGDEGSYHVSLTRDGSHAVFESGASNLIPGTTIPDRQIYVWDGQSLQLVSRAADGTPGNGSSSIPSISSDGTLIAYESQSSNLLGAGVDANDRGDIFVFNTRTQQTILVSQASDGSAGNGGSAAPVISGDGRFVVFQSDATNLDGGGASVIEVFVRDLVKNQTHLVSVAADGTFGSNMSHSASISEDGRYVTFVSYAPDLVANDTNSRADVFIVDGFAQGWWW